MSYKPIQQLLAKTGAEGDRNGYEFTAIGNSFDQLLREKEDARQYGDLYYKIGRNQILNSLLRGFFSEEEETKVLTFFHIPFTNSEWYSVIILSPQEMTYDQSIWMKLFLIVQSCCKDTIFDVTPVEGLDEDSIVIINRFSEFYDFDKAEEWVRILQSKIEKDSGISFHVYWGSGEKGLLGISKSYQNIKERKREELINQFTCHELVHDIEGNGDLKKHCSHGTERYYYPTDWEIQLIQHLRTGNQILSQRILTEIREENERRNLSEDMMHRVTTLIFETILRVMEEMDMDVSDVPVPPRKQREGGRGNRWDILKLVMEHMCICFLESDLVNELSLGDKMIQYLQENYARSTLSLSEMGDHFGLSISAASRLFKTSAGMNFIEYILSIRMEKAKEYLKTGEYSFARVAALVGYDNDVSFKRAFVRYEGMTPRQYANQLT